MLRLRSLTAVALLIDACQQSLVAVDCGDYGYASDTYAGRLFVSNKVMRVKRSDNEVLPYTLGTELLSLNVNQNMRISTRYLKGVVC